MWEQIKTFFAMGEYCVKEGVAYAPCRDYFWLAGFCAVVAVVISGSLYYAWRRWRLYAMRRASVTLTHEHLEMQKIVADETTMHRFKWKGDAVMPATPEQSDLTAKIRNALRARKLNG